MPKFFSPKSYKVGKIFVVIKLRALVPSRFNIAFKCGGKGYFIFNALKESIMQADEEAKDYFLSDEERCPLTMEEQEKLHKEGFLTTSREAEFNRLKIKFQHLKYSIDRGWIFIIPTYNCNLSCPYCYEDKDLMPKGHISDAMGQRISAFIKKFIEKSHIRHLSLGLYGGEPLLNFDQTYPIVQEVERFASEVGVHVDVSVVTNGTLITPDIARRLKELNTTEVQITLDGPKEVHDTRRITRDGRGTFDRIIESLRILKENEITPLLRINVDKENYDSIPELLDYLKEEKLDTALAFGFIVSLTDASARYRCAFNDEERDRLLLELKQLARDKGLTLANKELRPIIKQGICSYITDFAYLIDMLGDLYKCQNFVGLRDRKVGSLDENGEINYTDEFYNWMSRNPFDIPECRNCKLLPLCLGGCPAVAYSRYNTYHREGCQITNPGESFLWYLRYRYPEMFENSDQEEHESIAL